MLPIYECLITDEIDGMVALSLVDLPAVECDFVAFDKQEKPLMFAVENEMEHMVLGVVMRADFPIYRYSEDMGEYYVKYSKETIKQMSEKFLKDGLQNNINLMHNQERFVDGVELVQIFVKDSEKGISPKGFENIEEGSLFAQYHITNEEVWNSVMNGDFKGYSLEAMHTIIPVKQEYNKQENKYKSMLSKIKEILRSLLMEFGKVTIDGKDYFYEGKELTEDTQLYEDEEMTIKSDVKYVPEETKEEEPSEEQETPQEDVKEEEVVEETVEEEKPSEEEPKEEVSEPQEKIEEEVGTEEELPENPIEIPEEVSVPNADQAISVLQSQVEELKGEIEGLKAIVAELNAPVVPPIEAQFSACEHKSDSNKYQDIAEMLKRLR